MRIKLLCAIVLLAFTGILHSVAQSYNMSNGLYNTCSGTFYDSGGDVSPYQNNENKVTTFCSSNGGHIIFNFSSFALENYYDSLYIFDGSTTSSALIGTYTGTTSPNVVTSSGTCLTFRFHSDGSVNPAGWAASISCSAPLVPTVSFNTDISTGCAPLTVNFDNTSVNCANYYWYFGDGNYSYDANPSHVYTGTGQSYTVTLYAYDANWSYLGSFSSTITTNYSVNYFYMSEYNACPNTPISFYYPGTTSSYLWDFGDGTTSTASNPSHSYSTTGSYTVSLTAVTSCGTQTFYNYLTIDGNIQANAYFNYYTNGGYSCAGATISFSPYYNAASYAWDFGDSTSSNAQNPNHVYTASGSYNVTLTVTNACGNTNSYSQTVSIGGNTSFPTWVTLNANQQTVCTSTQAMFNTSGGFSQYIWNFGDGSPNVVGGMMGSNKEHIYTTAGNYTVACTIVDQCGNDTTLYTSINVSDSAPINYAYLNGNPMSCSNTPVYFSTSWGYQTYLWNMGDGTAPYYFSEYTQYSYADTGMYNYSVTITNLCGSDTTLYGSIHIINNQPVQGAYMGSNAGSGVCTGQPVNFYAGSWQPINSFVFDFGDGSPLMTTPYSNVSHTYDTAGSYTTSVTMTNGCGNDTTVSYTININGSGSGYFSGGAYLGAMKDIVCPGEEDQLWGSWGNYSAAVWNFGDGSLQDSIININGSVSHSHSFTSLGTYTVSVTIYDFCGADTTLYKTITVNNSNSFTENINLMVNPMILCPGGNAYFHAEYGFTSYVWDFGDGTGAAGQEYVSHTYDSAGYYMATVSVTNHCGVDSSMTVPVIVDNDAPVIGNPYLDVSSNLVCPGEVIDFRADNGYTMYIWNFGDGVIDTTTSRDMSHSYTTPGTYNVSVTYFNSCGNSKTVYSLINVNSNAPIANLQIQTNENGFCPGDIAFFNIIKNYYGGIGGNDNTPGYTYYWNFGDGSVDTTYGVGATHIYSAANNYTVTVIAENACGNSVTLSQNVSINNNSYPEVYFFGTANDAQIVGCPGDAVIFAYSGTTSNNTVSFGDGSSAVMTEQINTSEGSVAYLIRHAYLNTGNYWVTLELTNECGNTVRDSIYVTVGGNMLVNGGIYVEDAGGAGYTTCTPVQFVGYGGESYSWTFGDGTTLNSNAASVNHTFAQPGDYNVVLNVTNGCGNSASYNVSINISGSAGIATSLSGVADVTCNRGADGTATIDAVGGQAPYTYLWSNGATTATANNLSAGDYDVTVTDALGCAGVASVSITEPAPISLSFTTNPTDCSGATGDASVTPSGGTGPYTYSWSTGATTSSITGLPVGAYDVTVTSADGCSGTETVAVTSSNGASISVSAATYVTCFGGNNGALDIDVTGGVAPYTYQWSNDSTTQDIAGLPAGTYSVIVTDSANCQSVFTTTITEPSGLNASASVTNADCGQFNGAITITPSGGLSPYTYAWAGLSGTTNTQSGLPVGTYTANVTDANGCGVTVQATVNNSNAPVVAYNVTNVACFGGTNGSISTNVTGGTSPYLYTWLYNGSHSSSLSGIGQGSYIVKVQDASGCETYQTIQVTQPTQLTASVAVTPTNCGVNNGSATVTAGGGTSPYTYLWSSGGGTGVTASGLATGSYTVTVTDNKGCTVAPTANITESATPQPICVVTVDPELNKNVIVWEKIAGVGTTGYYIYKESNIAGVYNILTSVPYDSMSYYIDQASNPAQRSNRYKIQALDGCGNQSAMSTIHKTIHLNVNLGVPPTNVNLIWENYEGFNFGSYIIWRGIGLSSITQLDTVPSSITSYTDLNAPNADSLYYMIEMISPQQCNATMKMMVAGNYNSAKSNSAGVAYRTVGVRNNNQDKPEIAIYPNPNNGQFNLNIKLHEKETVELSLYNLQGELVYTQYLGNLNKGAINKVMDFTSLSNGIYNLQIKTSTSVVNHKVVIEQ